MFDVNLLYKLFGQQLEKFGLHFNLASPHIVRWYASVYIPNYFNILGTLILKFVYPAADLTICILHSQQFLLFTNEVLK